jgi:hypothetical protein
MERLVESYKTLFYLATQIFFFIEVYETYRDNEEYLNKVKFKGHYSDLPLAKAISGNLQNYTIIIGCSFIDEYNQEFTPFKHPEYADKISRIKKLTKPVMNRLNKWNNLKDYRNYILAHNFRIKGKSLFAKDVEPIKFNVPHTNSEFILLAELIRVVTTCIALEFPDLFEKLSSDDLPIRKMQFNYLAVDINGELETIREQIQEVKNSLP